MEKSDAIGWFGALGMAVAVVESFSINESMGWAIFHGFLSWLYVIYAAIVH
jgi:hypothetical protein